MEEVVMSVAAMILECRVSGVQGAVGGVVVQSVINVTAALRVVVIVAPLLVPVKGTLVSSYFKVRMENVGEVKDSTKSRRRAQYLMKRKRAIVCYCRK